MTSLQLKCGPFKEDNHYTNNLHNQQAYPALCTDDLVVRLFSFFPLDLLFDDWYCRRVSDKCLVLLYLTCWIDINKNEKQFVKGRISFLLYQCASFPFFSLVCFSVLYTVTTYSLFKNFCFILRRLFSVLYPSAKVTHLY